MNDDKLKQKCIKEKSVSQQDECRKLIIEICKSLYGDKYDADKSRSVDTAVRWEIKKLYIGKNKENKDFIPYYKDWRRKIKWLFIRLLEINPEDIFEDEEGEEIVSVTEEGKEKYFKEKTKNRYYQSIKYDITSYYNNIAKIIENSPAFFEEDLKYILLYKMAMMTKEKITIDINMSIELQDNYNFLNFPPTTSRNTLTQRNNFAKYIKKVVEEEPIAFLEQYKISVDERNQSLILKNANVDFQLALLFYPEFRKLFQKNVRCKYDYQSMVNIIRNVGMMSKISNVDKVLNLYVSEWLTGLNLCMMYTKYYSILLQKKECDKDMKDTLILLFREFAELPNVFSRIQIVRELMEPVIFFEHDIKKQLTVIRNVVRDIGERFKGMFDEIDKKIQKTSKKSQSAYIQGFKVQCKKIEHFKNVNQVLGRDSFIFVKQYPEIKENPSIYHNLQKEYLKKYK